MPSFFQGHVGDREYPAADVSRQTVEDLYRLQAQRHGPAGSVLGCRQIAGSFVQVYILPVQPEKLATAHSRLHGYRDNGGEPEAMQSRGIVRYRFKLTRFESPVPRRVYPGGFDGSERVFC